VAAAAATALLPGCSPFDGSVAPTGNKVVIPLSQFPALGSPGGGAVIDVQGSFPIVVVRTAADAASATSATCTHAYCILDHPAGAMQVHCNCHNAIFNLDGSIVRGPVDVPLPTYVATVSADAITVDLS
jgi:nitrite reductase/ring-hydroxylating ferredoxin subunit